MGQLMDRARALIGALPNEGATIIVVRNDIGRWLKQGITELRGKELAARCRTITIQHLSDCDKLMGLRGHVVIDGSFVNGRIRQEVKVRVDHMLAHPLVTVAARRCVRPAPPRASRSFFNNSW